MSCQKTSNDLGPHVCVKLINLVKQYPKIYVPSRESSLRSRNKRNELHKIWDNIATDVGIPAEDCKRRWRTLKDVYAKICKRRLQEELLGIKTKKKWLYEQNMSFMKFLFDEPYKEALENVEEVNLDDWKMDETETGEATEELLTDRFGDSKKKPSSKVEDQEDSQNVTIEYSQARLEALKDSQSQQTKAKSRFRAIRPKPYQLNLGTNRGVENVSVETSIVKVSSLSPQKMIVAANPALGGEKNCDSMILGSLNRIDRNKCLPVLNKDKTQFQIDPKKSSSNSVELFFKSMARSVMKLPTAIQAEIKMEICKLVTKAEIQYSLSDTSRSKNR